MKKKTNVIIITHSEEGLSQVCFALRLAMSLLSVGEKTMVYLSSEAAVWAHENMDRNQKNCGDDITIDILLKNVLELGGKISVCAPCYQDACGLKDNVLVKKTLINGVSFVGMTELAEILKEANVYTF